MKYLIMIAFLIFLQSCSNKISNDKVFNIDIYQNDITFDKYKQYVIEYAENTDFPSLSK